ncbi:MAG: AAA family ATPase, partial [Brevefilum sp.]
MAPTQLKIKLLGPVEITYNNKLLKIRRRLERAILYYLAAEDRPASRTELIDLLWAKKDEIDCRAALRTALSRLRSELPDEAMLKTELDQVWLDEGCCWLDLVKFKSSYDSLKNVLRAYQEDLTLPSQIVSQIEEALALWRGDEILQGDNLSAYPEIETWRCSLNRTLSHHRRTLMERLANHYKASGSLENALSLFIKLGEMDLLDVNCHLSVLEILIELRRFQEAVDYCDMLEIAYEEEFNAPLPEAILEQYQYSQIRLKANEQKEASEWPITPTMKLSLVGRDKELDQLQRVFYRGGIALIVGELGSGKTRLIQEFFHTCQPTPKLFFAPSQEMELSLPLSPIIHAFRLHITRDIWESIDYVWANKLIPLLPELAEYREDCTTAEFSGTPLAKQQLFDAIHHVLRTFTQDNRKILFFLDDAQWADKQTLEAISYLVAQGLFDNHGILIIAERSDEPNRDLNEMVDRFHRTKVIQRIEINGLSPSELAALVNQALNEDPTPEFLDRLYRETNGNPFLALEIIRNLLEFPGESDKFSFTSHLPLPENVHAVIRKRLNRLQETERQSLLHAAVIGNEFTLELLSAVTGLGSEFDIQLLDSMVNYGFIHQKGHDRTQKTTLKFTHEIMREVILKEATPVHLQAIHRRVAEHLSNDPRASSQAALIANHYLAAGEIALAFQWFLKSASHAWTLGAKDETHQIYQQAESLYRNAPSNLFSTTEVLELYRQWGQFAYEADQIDLLEEIGFKLQYLGEQEHDPLLLGVSQMSLANACFLRLNMDTGLELITKAIHYFEHTGHQLVMLEAKLRQALIYWWTMDYDATIQACQESLRIGESIESSGHNLSDSLFLAKNAISYAYIAKGNAKK